MQRPVLVHGGKVVKGEGIGRTLGFPTANLVYKELHLSGTYAGRAIVGGGIYKAAIYANQPRNILEAHLLDINLDLADKPMVLELYEKVSDAETLTSEEALKSHIRKSVELVRQKLTF